MNIPLNSSDYLALSPLIILLCGALGILFLESFMENKAKKYSFYATVFLFFLAFVAVLISPISENPLLTSWLRFDPLAKFFTFFFLLIGIASAFLTSSFFSKFDASNGEYYFLLISAIIGLILIGASEDFLTLFIGIETLSISLYVLCGYIKSWEFSHEASIKYFLMGSLAAAFLLYGIALLYGATGTTKFSSLLSGYHSITDPADKAIFLSGIAFVTLALSFEAALVPFQVWAPDVYDGAPTPVTGFMAVGTKVGAFAAFIRVFTTALPDFNHLWNEGISFLVYPTLILANIAALRQIQLRRFFAYSGISHAGFMLIPIAVGTPEAISSLLFYLIVYALATLGAFAVISYLENQKEGILLNDLRGLFRRMPLPAFILTISLLTLTGIPPTAGFFAKFYVFKTAFQTGYIGLVVVGLLTAILSIFYYLRFITVMLSDSNEEQKFFATRSSIVLGTICCGLIFLFSVYPQAIIDLLPF